MRELRDPPAFQWYPTELMSDEAWILATLSQRGLFATLRNYCWRNGSLPADHGEQARLLNLDASELQDAAQCRLISHHFKINDGRLYCTELLKQRAAMQLRRERMQKGGSKGGKKAQQTRAKSKPPSSDPSSLAQAPEKRRDEKSREEVYQAEGSTEEFLRGYGDE
jgi:hypothetical protein